METPITNVTTLHMDGKKILLVPRNHKHSVELITYSPSYDLILYTDEYDPEINPCKHVLYDDGRLVLV